MAGPPTASQQALYDILDAIGQRLLAAAAPRVESVSRALSEALDYKIEIDLGSTYIEVPHFWALYLHDGRGPFMPRRDRADGKKIAFLVWFPNPADDPRLRNGPPVRAEDIRPLTKEEFDYGLLQNTERRGSGGLPYMRVARYWPNPTPGKFFFSEPCTPVADEVPEIAANEMLSLLGDLGDELADKRVTRANLKLR